MSVITTSGEKKASAKKHIEDAVKDLSAIIIDKEWVWDSFSDQYREEIVQMMFELIKIGQRL